VKTLTPALSRHPSPYRRGEPRTVFTLSYRERVAAKLPGEGLNVVGWWRVHRRQHQYFPYLLENLVQSPCHIFVSHSQDSVTLGAEPSISSQVVLLRFGCVVDCTVNLEDEAGGATIKISDVTPDDFLSHEFCVVQSSVSHGFPHQVRTGGNAFTLCSSQFDQVRGFALHRSKFRTSLRYVLEALRHNRNGEGRR
jgi:hypothetical protein